MYTPFHESVIRDQQTSAVADVIEQVLLRDIFSIDHGNENCKSGGSDLDAARR